MIWVSFIISGILCKQLCDARAPWSWTLPKKSSDPSFFWTSSILFFNCENLNLWWMTAGMWHFLEGKVDAIWIWLQSSRKRNCVIRAYSGLGLFWWCIWCHDVIFAFYASFTNQYVVQVDPLTTVLARMKVWVSHKLTKPGHNHNTNVLQLCIWDTICSCIFVLQYNFQLHLYNWMHL